MRQGGALFGGLSVMAVAWEPTKRATLAALLRLMFGSTKVHLDHDPALALREKVRNAAGEIVGYVPAANDPAFLVYRAAVDHIIKTRIRGVAGQYSDHALIRRERRRQKKKRKTALGKAKQAGWGMLGRVRSEQGLAGKGKAGRSQRPSRPLRSASRWPTGRKLPTGQRGFPQRKRDWPKDR